MTTRKTTTVIDYYIKTNYGARKGSWDNQPALGRLCHVKFVDSISYFLCDQGHCSLDHFIQLATVYWARTILAI